MVQRYFYFNIKKEKGFSFQSRLITKTAINKGNNFLNKEF